MTTRIDLPDGEWAELKDIGQLTGADQDVAFDTWDRLMEGKPQPEPQPDPANPAVMLPAPPRRFSNADGREMRDVVLGLAVTAWSFDVPLPYTAESRRRLPVLACNALYKAADPIQDALLGVEKDEDEDPKPPEPSPGSDGSTGTSPESTESPLPAPPAVLSAMP
jgi:hypothetical protein